MWQKVDCAFFLFVPRDPTVLSFYGFKFCATVHLSLLWKPKWNKHFISGDIKRHQPDWLAVNLPLIQSSSNLQSLEFCLYGEKINVLFCTFKEPSLHSLLPTDASILLLRCVSYVPLCEFLSLTSFVVEEISGIKESFTAERYYAECKISNALFS